VEEHARAGFIGNAANAAAAAAAVYAGSALLLRFWAKWCKWFRLKKQKRYNQHKMKTTRTAGRLYRAAWHSRADRFDEMPASAGQWNRNILNYILEFLKVKKHCISPHC
jgi:hypothetical protein